MVGCGQRDLGRGKKDGQTGKPGLAGWLALAQPILQDMCCWKKLPLWMDHLGRGVFSILDHV